VGREVSVVPIIRRVVPGAAIVAIVLLAGCAENTPSVPVSSPIAPSSPTVTTPVPTPESPAKNDLAEPRRTIKTSGLTVDVTYSPRLPVEDWTPSANKPLALSLTTKSGKSGQKVYLTRVTLTITARDEQGPLDSPKPLVDTANISPGFIVTAPYTYGQDFAIPALDQGATSVTLGFSYEFLLQVSKDSKDYYKQTAIDTLVVPLAD
jgi:hypothetical protein